MARHVLTHAARQPDKVALEIVTPEDSVRWRYGALEERVLRIAGGLSARGLPVGARVLIRIGNSPAFPMVFLGAIAAGLLPVPSSAELTQPELDALIDDLDPALIVHAPGVTLPSRPQCPVIGAESLADHPRGDYVMGAPERPAYIVYTSGTSGRPRGVVHAHRAIWARRMMWRDWYDLRATDRLLHAGAFNWTYTMGTGLMDPWAMGATALIPAPGLSRAGLAAAIRAHKATIFAAAPGVYRQLLESGSPLDMPHLRHGLSAGEKLPEATRAAWKRATGTGIYEALGMSEISTFISARPGEALPGGALGRVQRGRRVAVLDTCDHKPVAMGHPGILAVSRRDPGLMLGYLNADAETAARMSGEWFLTGDMVSMDESGAVTYLGRDDDMMNAGGFRVSPLEVESVLNAHPSIHESAATAVEIREGVLVIAAFYRSDIELDEGELAEFCAARLARYKRPRLFRRLQALPRGANGKIRRASLREGFRKGA